METNEAPEKIYYKIEEAIKNGLIGNENGDW